MNNAPVTQPVYLACFDSRGMNPSVEELSLQLQGLSEEEKRKIKEVMVREQVCIDV